jgi:hypothetical protein
VGFLIYKIGVLLAKVQLSIESSLILWQEEIDKDTVS